MPPSHKRFLFFARPADFSRFYAQARVPLLQSAVSPVS